MQAQCLYMVIVKKVFFSETDKLNPLSCYGLSKQTSEKYLELFKKKFRLLF